MNPSEAAPDCSSGTSGGHALYCFGAHMTTPSPDQPFATIWL